MTHLLDTHAWIWFFNRDPHAQELVATLSADARLGVAAITIWETAMLEAKGRVSLHLDLDAAGAKCWLAVSVLWCRCILKLP